MCVEWLKVNHRDGLTEPAHTTPSPMPASQPSQATPPKPEARDLFGNPIEATAPKPRPTASPSVPVVTSHQPKARNPIGNGGTPPLRAVTEADVASFKATSIEACFETEALGPVWIVPEYTEQPRRELKVEHAMVLAAVASVFPDAKLTALKRPSDR
jgi:hypothetical protein